MSAYDYASYYARNDDAESASASPAAGLTPLMQAAKEGDAAKIRKLVADGAAVEEKDRNGWTALFHAVKNRHVKAVAELITAGASVTAEARNGLTPLSLAVKSGSPLIIELVAKAGGQQK